MIFQPAIIALLLGSLLISLMLIYSTYDGAKILKKWNIQSGSELQLILERQTYLISTLMAYAFGFQLISLFLFIYTADKLSPLFVGAMCAAGSLNVNQWGYPAIIMKILDFLLAGLWLIINFTDNRAYDYPLIKKKYGLLLFITPFILAEAFLQGSYFLSLQPEVITSCCGTLFTSERTGVTSEIISLPRTPVAIAFSATMGLTFATGSLCSWKGKGGYLFSVASFFNLVVSALAFISFICLYFYELPTHHCPFCILQKEYSYVGYPIYLTFLGGAVLGMGAGVITPFQRFPSLNSILPSIRKKLVFFSLLFHALFLAIVVYALLFSSLTL